MNEMGEEKRGCDCVVCRKKATFDRVDRQLGFIGLPDGWLPVRRKVWSGERYAAHYAAACSLPCALAWTHKHSPATKSFTV